MPSLNWLQAGAYRDRMGCYHQATKPAICTREKQMSIPDFQSLLLPILTITGDNQEHTGSEVTDTLARQLNLSAEDRSEMLAGGRQGRFVNRVSWAKSYLKMACLVSSTGRGKYRITSRGLDVLSKAPIDLDIRYLMQFPEFAASRHNTRQNSRDAEELGAEHPQTPEEALETSYQNLRRTLAQELLEKIKQASPAFFETLVVDLLVAMGYGGSRKDAGEAVGRSGDDGIDGIIKEDKLGLDAITVDD